MTPSPHRRSGASLGAGPFVDGGSSVGRGVSAVSGVGSSSRKEPSVLPLPHPPTNETAKPAASLSKGGLQRVRLSPSPIRNKCEPHYVDDRSLGPTPRSRRLR